MGPSANLLPAAEYAKVTPQMKKLLLLTLMTAACLTTARAAISVGPGGSGTLAFPTNPIVTEFATAVLNGAAATYTTGGALDTGVNTVAATSNFFKVLPTSGTVPPSAFSGGMRFNTAGLYLQSRPTTDVTNAAGLLMATLQNDSGAPISTLNVSYTFAFFNLTVEEIVGFHAYWSLTGLPGSWTLIPTLSDITNAGTHSAAINVGSWAASSTMYLLWADDNSAATDGSYTIDNMVIAGGTLPLSVTLTAPTNSILIAPATVVASATPSGGSAPVTGVTFFTNGVPFVNDTTSPYSGTLNNLPNGTYTIFARASNGVDPDADSASVTVLVRGEFIDYVSGTHSENFDASLGATGIVTPQGWWVGAAAAGTAQFVSVGDGSAGPAAAAHGLNYGLTGDGNRALGSSPTGGDRNTVARIHNVSAANIDAFNIFFDAELWRTHNTNTHIEYLTNYVSFDLGASWIPTAFLFQSPPDIANTPASFALDGHQATNRVAGLGGNVVAPAPVPPGGVIYIRWNNFNDPGTDGAIAIDNVTFQATATSPATHFVTVTSPANGATISGGCSGSTNVTVTATASFTTTNVAFQIDGGAVVNDSTAPFSVTFPNVGLGLHTITATAKNSAGATAVTNSSFTVQANTSPVILYTNVYSYGVTGFVFAVGSPVTNQFGITDTDGTIANVEFLVNGSLLYATNINFGQIIVNNLLAGSNTFTVRATDNCGGITQNSHVVIGTNPAAPTVVIVTNGALWKYNNLGALPPNDLGGNLWYQSAFDDSLWLSGLAEIGGGDSVAPPNNAAERTVIDIGPAATRYSAIYFRKTFTVANPALFGSLVVQSLYDDGSAVYLNGTLVATFNTTNAGVPFAYTDLAGAADPSDGTRYYASNIVNSLVVGVNTLAVEVHQNSLTSSDLSFDLMLWGVPPTGTALHIVQISPTQAEVSWPDSTPVTALLYSTTDLTAPAWSLVGLPILQSGGFFRVTVNTTGAEKFYTLRQ